MSFLNDATLDYVSLNADGIGVLGLSSLFVTKQITDEFNSVHSVHSLASCDYLKLSQQNHLLFSC